MISVMLNLFDTRGSLMTLLKHMIDREVAHTGVPLFNLFSDTTLTCLPQTAKPHYSEAILRAPDFCPPLLKCMDMHIFVVLSSHSSRAWRRYRLAMVMNSIPKNRTLEKQKLLKILKMSSLLLLRSSRSSLLPSQRFPRTVSFLSPQSDTNNRNRMFREICAHISRVVLVLYMMRLDITSHRLF
jgi:hypothetical protein